MLAIACTMVSIVELWFYFNDQQQVRSTWLNPYHSKKIMLSLNIPRFPKHFNFQQPYFNHTWYTKNENKILHISNNKRISRSILARRINYYSKKKFHFKIVNFSEIKFVEPRSKINLLRSTNQYIKNFSFKNIDNLIKKKTKLLDKT